MERKIIIPAIYKHFKHIEGGEINNFMYAVMFVSKPKDFEFITNLINSSENLKKFEVFFTENDEKELIYCINGEWYHSSKYSNEELVIYKSLYDNHIPYARPLKMFLEEVPEGKENPSNQKYRFELVKY